MVITDSYRVEFTHLNREKESEHIDKIHDALDVLTPSHIEQIRAATICKVYGTDGDEVSRGISKCSMQENFSKSKGRYYAMRKALWKLDRGERTKIWNEYYGGKYEKK